MFSLNTVKQILIEMLYKDVTALRLSLSWAALILCYGFIVQKDSSANHYLTYFASYGNWAALFFVYGISMFITCFFKLHRAIICVIDAVGVWAWVYLFLVFSVLTAEPNTVAEYMLLVPVLSSVWVIVDRLFKTYIYDVVLNIK